MLRALKIFAILLSLTFADLVVAFLIAFACITAAWVSLTHTPISTVVEVLFSEPTALLTQAPRRPDGLRVVLLLIGLGSFVVFGGLLVASYREVMSSPTHTIRTALRTLVTLSVPVLVLVPLCAVAGVWLSRILAVGPTIRWLFFVAGGLIGFGVCCLFLYALRIAGQPGAGEILRGRAREDPHA